VFQRAVVVTINTVVVSVIFEPRCKHRFEDVEVNNFASVNIVSTTLAAVSVIVAH